MAKCPYSDHDNSTKPHRRGTKYYAACDVCGRMAAAHFYNYNTGGAYYTLSRVGRSSIGAAVKRVRTVRLSDSEMAAIERGALRLVVCNNRITVSA
jgi:hypothetical protein